MSCKTLNFSILLRLLFYISLHRELVIYLVDEGNNSVSLFIVVFLHTYTPSATWLELEILLTYQFLWEYNSRNFEPPSTSILIPYGTWTCLLFLAILYFIFLYVFLLYCSAHFSLAEAISSIFAIISMNEKKREAKRKQGSVIIFLSNNVSINLRQPVNCHKFIRFHTNPQILLYIHSLLIIILNLSDITRDQSPTKANSVNILLLI